MIPHSEAHVVLLATEGTFASRSPPEDGEPLSPCLWGSNC